MAQTPMDNPNDLVEELSGIVIDLNTLASRLRDLAYKLVQLYPPNPGE